MKHLLLKSLTVAICAIVLMGCTNTITCPLCNGTNVICKDGQSMKCPICKDGKVTEKRLQEVTQQNLPCAYCGGSGFAWGGPCSHCMGRGMTSFLDFNLDLIGRSSSSSPAYQQPERDFSKCPICHGNGKCSACAGNGWVIIEGQQCGCAICKGNGRCKQCYGSGKFTR